MTQNTKPLSYIIYWTVGTAIVSFGLSLIFVFLAGWSYCTTAICLEKFSTLIQIPIGITTLAFLAATVYIAIVQHNSSEPLRRLEEYTSHTLIIDKALKNIEEIHAEADIEFTDMSRMYSFLYPNNSLRGIEISPAYKEPNIFSAMAAESDLLHKNLSQFNQDGPELYYVGDLLLAYLNEITCIVPMFEASYLEHLGTNAKIRINDLNRLERSVRAVSSVYEALAKLTGYTKNFQAVDQTFTNISQLIREKSRKMRQAVIVWDAGRNQ